MNLVAGTILGVVFQLAHVVEDITYPTPDAAGAMGSAWMAHEMETTSDFGPQELAALLVCRRAELPGGAPPLPEGVQHSLSRPSAAS